MHLKIDDIKKLHQKKYRNEFGYFLVEGEHLVLELQKAAAQNVGLSMSQLLVTEHYANWNSEFPITVISEKNMAHISDTKSPQGIIAVVPFLPSASLTQQAAQHAVYLHEIQDPGNLGTILRTLAWFGNFRCILSPNSVDPYNPKVVRASMGAIFHVPIALDVPINTLAKHFQQIAYLDMQGDSLSSMAFHTCECYVFGNEARGVPREYLDALKAKAFTIQGAGMIESLNLASAVNMCVYELNR